MHTTRRERAFLVSEENAIKDDGGFTTSSSGPFPISGHRAGRLSHDLYAMPETFNEILLSNSEGIILCFSVFARIVHALQQPAKAVIALY